MKKSLSMISSALLLSAMLAACNTDSEQTTNSSENDQTETEVKNTETETDTTTVEETTTTNEQSEQQSTEENSSEPSKLTFTSNDKEMTENAIVSTSDELGYTITHLENYTLESEEPGIDHLFYNADNTLSMQIKVANAQETSFDDVNVSSKETIAAIASEGNYKELDLSEVKANASDIQNIIGYETILDSEKVTIVTFEKDSKIITLTIYDTKEADLTDAFLKMGLTIQ